MSTKLNSFSQLRDYLLPENLDGRLDRIASDLPLKDSSPLKRIFDIGLVLDHGQAEVERGFSTNKEVTDCQATGVSVHPTAWRETR